MFEIVFAVVPPPGTFQTITARSRTIATLRRCFMPSEPTPRRLDGRDELLGDGRGRDLGHRRGLDHRRGGGIVLDRLGREPVADPEVRVDVPPPGRDAL